MLLVIGILETTQNKKRKKTDYLEVLGLGETQTNSEFKSVKEVRC